MKRLLCIAGLAACGDPAPAFEVAEPLATAELIPGGRVDMIWAVGGGPAQLEIAVRPLAGSGPAIPIFDEEVVDGEGNLAWDGTDLDGELVPVQVYDLLFTLKDGGEVVDEITRSVAVHGVVWLDPAPGETLTLGAGDVPADFRIRTVSQRELSLSFKTGDVVLHEDTIPGEFVAFDRQIPFVGTDAAGAPLPAGTYPLAVEVDDPDTDLFYRVDGGELDWTP